MDMHHRIKNSTIREELVRLLDIFCVVQSSCESFNYTEIWHAWQCMGVDLIEWFGFTICNLGYIDLIWAHGNGFLGFWNIIYSRLVI